MNEISPTLLLGIAAAGALGFLILLIVGINMWREERAGKSGGEPQKPEATEAPAAEDKGPSALRSLWSSVSAAASSRPAKGGEHEVLRVLRDNLTGRLIVDVAGRRFNKMGDLHDPVISQGFLTTLQDLQEFVRGAPPVQAPPTGASDPQPAPPPTPSPEPMPPPSASAPQPEPPPPVNPPKTITRSAELPPIRMPSMNPFKQAQILRDLSKEQPLALKTIPEEIDELLQQRVLGTPLVRRGVHVRSGPTGSVAFELDGKAYAAIDEVPDADVQAVFRAAIAEWESQR